MVKTFLISNAKEVSGLEFTKGIGSKQYVRFMMC